MNATNEQIEKGKELAEKLKVTVLYINDKGEYFTSDNLAQLSVKGDKKKYQKLDYSAAVKDEIEDDEIQEINKLQTVEEVQALLDIELEGENRSDVVEACKSRIEELENQE
jgi:hypothetical protein